MPNTHNDKKRKRPLSADDQLAPAVAPHVIHWLEKRKKKVPDALSADQQNQMQIEQILRLLALKERERRALVRYVEKCIDEEMNGGPKKVELQDSDGEYDIKSTAAASHHHKQQELWPADVMFSNNYDWESSVPADLKEKYCPSNKIRQRTNYFSRNVYFKRITDKDHPAYGEFGLYCALAHAKPGQWLLDYVGRVTLGEDQNKKSDYVSDFGEHSELACDANVWGNEARFLNDFRNTGQYPNVEFNFRRDKNGEFRQGVYVKEVKEAKEKGFDGIKQDEELLVSYGKSYWRSRVDGGDLTEFVWRLPNQPMPPGGKPN
eukprot:scaffold30338_cov148-Skeletonema_menzelii.AAC.3